MTGSAGLGFRAGDFVELSARLRALPFDNTLASTQGASSAAPVNLLYGGRLALHIDGDGDRRTAFVFGGEVLGGSLRDGTALTELGFVLGPRFGITDKMFASLLLAPSLLIPASSPYGEPSTVGQIMITRRARFRSVSRRLHRCAAPKRRPARTLASRSASRLGAVTVTT